VTRGARFYEELAEEAGSRGSEGHADGDLALAGVARASIDWPKLAQR